MPTALGLTGTYGWLKELVHQFEDGMDWAVKLADAAARAARVMARREQPPLPPQSEPVAKPLAAMAEAEAEGRVAASTFDPPSTTGA